MQKKNLCKFKIMQKLEKEEENKKIKK